MKGGGFKQFRVVGDLSGVGEFGKRLWRKRLGWNEGDGREWKEWVKR